MRAGARVFVGAYDIVLENPIVLAALICFLLGLALSGLVRVVPGSTIASTVMPIVFLTSYVLAYQQVPPFPPIGATNKIFYIALAAALIGFVLDLLPQTANYGKPLAVILPLLIVGWIGLPRFAKLDVDLMAPHWASGWVVLPCYGASIRLRGRRPTSMAAASSALQC